MNNGHPNQGSEKIENIGSPQNGPGNNNNTSTLVHPRPGRPMPAPGYTNKIRPIPNRPARNRPNGQPLIAQNRPPLVPNPQLGAGSQMVLGEQPKPLMQPQPQQQPLILQAPAPVVVQPVIIQPVIHQQVIVQPVIVPNKKI